MKLIGNSLTIFILTWAWELLLWVKHSASLHNFLQSLIFCFIKKSSHIIDWSRFLLFVEISTRTNNCIYCVSLKSCCFRIEVTLWAFIETCFLSSLRIVCSWTWSFHLFYFSNNSKTISCRGKTGRNWLASFQFIVILSRTRKSFLISFDHSICFPRSNSFLVKTTLRNRSKRIWVIL